MSEVVVVIHQPNFFPWLGYFDKIARSDRFVVLDHVQFPRNGMLNRVKLLIGGESRWLTAPVRHDGLQSIEDISFASDRWQRKSIATLQTAYRRAPFFDETMALIEPLLVQPTGSLAAFNLRAVKRISSALGIDTAKMVCSSKLAVEGAATELLVAIVKATGGSTYMAGGGAAGYQVDDKFTQAGLAVVYQDFAHPSYPQHGQLDEFVPGLSVIDALMNVGIDEVPNLIGGRRSR